MKNNQISVLELFAGVGGFRLGLEGFEGKSSSSGYHEPLENRVPYKVLYSNQWEPSVKVQHANIIYKSKFQSNGHFPFDIKRLIENVSGLIDNKCDLLTAGFPCPDFSVASLRKNSKGVRGNKGKLWFSIIDLIEALKKRRMQPNYLLFENVDRMLKSPTYPVPGKDFKVILGDLDRLKYNVEWKVINAADYGFPQKRKRVFIFCHKRKDSLESVLKSYSNEEIVESKGIISSAFNSEIIHERKDTDNCKFADSGIMKNGLIKHFKTKPIYDGKYQNLGDVIYNGKIPTEYFLNEADLDRWRYEKGRKEKPKITPDGKPYTWSEGSIQFPDLLEKPSRTIITSEGGKSVSRIRHVIFDKTYKKYRRLLPIEIEQLNMFPKDFTKHDGIIDSRRVFLMGNAIVVGVVEKIGQSLSNLIFKMQKN